MSGIPPPRPHFVLVHGLGHGAWCWYKIRCLMEASGNKVTCLDLKGAGIDPSDPNSILTLEDYNQPLIHFFSNLPEHEKVILVGHSAGGLSVTDAIHRFPRKIHIAIYVAANMLQHGFSTDQDVKDDVSLASMLVRQGAVRAIREARFVGGGPDVDRVPRVYIKAMQDRVVKPEQQDAMIKRWPPSQVFVLESDHSPFFSTPFSLFGFLLKAAQIPPPENAI